MRLRSIDPSPRRYASTVTLAVRSARGPASAPSVQTPEEIEAWLLGAALREDDTVALVEAFAWRLAAASGLGIDRISLHVGTLHPQAIGLAWNWSRGDGLCDEIRVLPGATLHESFVRTPIARVVQHGEQFRGDPRDRATAEAYPFLGDLAAQGLTDYIAFPIGQAREDRHNAATIATAGADGFSRDALETLERLFRVFALHMARHVALRISANVATTYLGEAAGRLVLDGSIRRGAGVSAEGLIWMSDLRGFTDLSERLAPNATLAVLDAYFDVMAGAVMDCGGQVLKFMGDGLLAAFGGPDFSGQGEVAAAALVAARRALADLDMLNASPPATLATFEGWHPLRTGIGLHTGEAFFGNVGGADRLDFTVIGRAVNVASRVEGLCRPLGRTVLLTGAVARHVAEPLDDLGEHALKGIAEPVRIYGLRS